MEIQTPETDMIVLNTAEMKLAEYIGKCRDDFDRKNNFMEMKRSPKTSLEINCRGVAAEIAFCKLFNLYPDTNFQHVATHDAVLPTGETVDVKCTTMSTGHLLALPHKSKAPADLYALMISVEHNAARFRFAGFATSEQLFTEATLTDLSHGPTHHVPQKMLWGARK